MKDIDTFTANEPQVLLKCTFPNWSIEYTTEHQLNERYLMKLSKEKKDWIEYKQTLHENYLKLKRLNSSGERIPKNTNFLDHLSNEDREFMEILNKRKDEYAYLCSDALPKMNENLSLLTYEFENQVEMIKQISNNYELCLDKLQELICYDDELDDVEIFASQFTSVNEKSTMFDEPVLFIEEI
uniref:Uncharacterized protein n=1 Tax=Rhodnius prolixus TaxID=13249 RepID=T1I706_RHOPR